MVELIYKCRNCGKKFSFVRKAEVEDLDDFVKKYKTGITDKCSNCCLKSTNNTETHVIADLVKVIVGKEE